MIQHTIMADVVKRTRGQFYHITRSNARFRTMQ